MPRALTVLRGKQSLLKPISENTVGVTGIILLCRFSLLWMGNLQVCILISLCYWPAFCPLTLHVSTLRFLTSLQVPSSRNSVGISLETRRQHLNGSLQTLACSAPHEWSGNQCPLGCWLSNAEHISILLKLIELPLKLLELKEMWKVTINLSPCPFFHIHFINLLTPRFMKSRLYQMWTSTTLLF